MKVRICVAVDDTGDNWIARGGRTELGCWSARDAIHELELGANDTYRLVWVEAEIPDAPEAVEGEVVG